MATWTPISKATGIEYPAVSDLQKQEMENDPITKGKYRFKAASADAPKTIKPKQEKTPLKPIGVEIPDEPNEEKETGVTAL